MHDLSHIPSLPAKARDLSAHLSQADFVFACALLRGETKTNAWLEAHPGCERKGAGANGCARAKSPKILEFMRAARQVTLGEALLENVERRQICAAIARDETEDPRIRLAACKFDLEFEQAGGGEQNELQSPLRKLAEKIAKSGRQIPLVEFPPEIEIEGRENP